MEVKGLRVLVLGLGKSGIAAAKLLKARGAEVVVNDAAPEEKVSTARQELEALGIQVITGGHPAGIVSQEVSLVVKNPGIPYRVEPVQAAIRLGIPVVTEVEVASWYIDAPFIGITGSNGKTTTTTLVGEILQTAKMPSLVAGNIGRALTDVVQEVLDDQWIVAELSSFQLMGTQTFRPKIAAWLNLFPAHLDYHTDMEEYRAAKQKIFANQTENDFAVLNWDMPEIQAFAGQVKARVIPVSLRGKVPNGVYVSEGAIYAELPFDSSKGTAVKILSVSDVCLRGEHNLQNVLFAIAISLAAGAPIDAIEQVITTFQGVEHRLEFVREYRGVRYYNDSKSTNAVASSKALLTFSGDVIWIAGGLDRGDDFETLVPLLSERVKTVIAIGQSQEKILAAAARAGIEARIATHDLEDAVRQAANIAKPGDAVLLSPACASWDMFSSFEERGRIFKQAVHRM